MKKQRIVFLGTGGGGTVTYTQVRKTGGIYFELSDKKFILDPGPGSLVYSQKLGLKPDKWCGLLLSHIHPDHATDANVLLDGMAREKKPFLIAEEHCLKLKGDDYPCISRYHQKISQAYPVKPGDTVDMDGVEIAVNKADHYSPTVGFTISYGKIKIGYPSDGFYYKGQGKNYDCDVLILNILIPAGKKATKKHMSTEEAIKLVKEIQKKPRLVIIQHFSFWMLRASPWSQAKIIEDATGVKTIPAEDFMELELDTMKIRKLKEK